MTDDERERNLILAGFNRLTAETRHHFDLCEDGFILPGSRADDLFWREVYTTQGELLQRATALLRRQAKESK